MAPRKTRRRIAGSASASNGPWTPFAARPEAKLIPSTPRFEVHHESLKIIQLETSETETFQGVQGLFSQPVAMVHR
jgi:hypothetical protein